MSSKYTVEEVDHFGIWSDLGSAIYSDREKARAMVRLVNCQAYNGRAFRWDRAVTIRARVRTLNPGDMPR